jgi:hypoxanthine phosphoribosyltransferase
VEDDFIDETVFVGVLNGSFMVVSDFMKKNTQNLRSQFLKMAL